MCGEGLFPAIKTTNIFNLLAYKNCQQTTIIMLYMCHNTGVHHETIQYKLMFWRQLNSHRTHSVHTQAYKRRLFYPGYAWIMVGIDIENLPSISLDNCTTDNIKQVVNNSLTIQPTVRLKLS